MMGIFRGGVPTEIEVKRLREAFPDPAPGQLISYEDVAVIIGAKHGTNRFTAVTNAWRRSLLRADNIVVNTVAGQGFQRLTEEDRSEADRTGWRKDQQRAARKVRDLSRVDTRDFDERTQRGHDHAQRVLQAHAEHTSKSVRELAPPPAMKLLPRRAPGGSK
jgi:hypothetical protein